MKVSYISDLHLDSWVQFGKNQIKAERNTRKFIQELIESDVGSKEVLCVAGDISHYNEQSYWALEEFAKRYEIVLFCLGNHDHYLISRNQSDKYNGRSLLRTEELTRSAISIGNVVPLFQGRVWEHGGVKFGGDTMWYPLDTVEQKVFFYDISNDSRLIKDMDIAFERFISTQEYKNMLEEGIDVMISHVPLCHTRSHEKYNSTSCYYSPVDELPRYVVQGHCHERIVYNKAGTLLYMNALGYRGENLQGENEIKSFVINKEEL